MRIIILLSIVMLSTLARATPEQLVYKWQTIQLDGVRQQVKVPRGYRLELLSGALRGPRLLTFANNGDLFIGSNAGHVYRLMPPYTQPQVLVTLSGYPHSVAIRSGEILIARTNGLYRAPYQPGQAKISPSDVSLLAALPAGGGHSSRSVAIGPDGKVYLSLGITGNCSDEYLGDSYSFDDRRGGVLQLQQTTNKVGWKVFASGLRNPIGFDWHPVTGVMYASNHGPDHLGYDLPPEYFSRVTAGSFHGMPWYQFDGKQLLRDECISSRPPLGSSEVVLPVATFPARNAPMGVTFVPKGAMDTLFENAALVALHGSWGTRPSGGFFGSAATRRPPKIVAVQFHNGGAQKVIDVITGFQLKDGERWARPAGVAIGPDGALYFTSDGGTHGLFRLRKLP